jgi:hypothetical protein
VQVRVPDAGRITLAGAAINSIGRSIARAGIYRLRIQLTPNARRALRRQHKLKLRLRFGYAPPTGRSSSITVSLTVGR